jgi:hypothetical protein
MNTCPSSHPNSDPDLLPTARQAPARHTPSIYLTFTTKKHISKLECFTVTITLVYAQHMELICLGYTNPNP